MRFVIQRVLESEVKVDGESLGKIGKGFMVLIGVSDSDTKEVADKMVKKMLGLRIFEDEQGKTNLSLESVQASSKRVHRIWHRICMSTLLRNAKNRYRL